VGITNVLGFTVGQIDDGSVQAEVNFWEQGLNQGSASDSGYVSLTFLNADAQSLAAVATPEIDAHNGVWQNEVMLFSIPAGTRMIAYSMQFVRHAGSDLDGFIDDNSLRLTNTIAPLTNFPNLMVSGVTVPADAWTESSFGVSWTVTNAGTAAAMGPWVDKLYLSMDGQLQSSTDFLLGVFPFGGSLAVGQSVKRTQTVTINGSGITNGAYHVLVLTDAATNLNEGTFPRNTLGASAGPAGHRYVDGLQCRRQRHGCATLARSSVSIHHDQRRERCR